MIEEGRAFALTLAVQHLLRTLERKGIMSADETREMLEDTRDDLVAVRDRGGVLSQGADADAVRTIGALELPVLQRVR